MTVGRCGERELLLHGDFERRPASFITMSVHISVQHDARMQRVGLSIGYWYSVNSASSTYIISADFLIVLYVLFNFHFKRTR